MRTFLILVICSIFSFFVFGNKAVAGEHNDLTIVKKSSFFDASFQVNQWDSDIIKDVRKSSDPRPMSEVTYLWISGIIDDPVFNQERDILHTKWGEVKVVVDESLEGTRISYIRMGVLKEMHDVTIFVQNKERKESWEKTAKIYYNRYVKEYKEEYKKYTESLQHQQKEQENIDERYKKAKEGKLTVEPR